MYESLTKKIIYQKSKLEKVEPDTVSVKSPGSSTVQ